MDVVLAAMSIGLLCVGLAVTILVIGRAVRGQTRVEAVKRAEVKRSAQWQVADISTRQAMLIVVQRVTDEGEVLGRVVVASVPDGAEDWEDQVLKARLEAASRAQLLNSEV
jgi:hypothetical protein